jgi:putative flippase GtrA
MYQFLFLFAQKNRQFISYSIIGVTGATIDFVLFSIFVKSFSINYLISNTISVSAGITNNFLLNTFLNFKVKDKLAVRFFRFYTIGISGLLMSSVMLYIFITLLHMDTLISKAITIIFVVILQYTLNKKYSFSRNI